MPARRLLSAIACCVLAAVACDSFNPGTTNPTGDGGTSSGGTSSGETPNPDGGETPNPDGGADGNGLYPTCPPTSTGSKFSNLSPRTIVKAADGFDFPFGISTDSKYVFWVSQFVPKDANGDAQTAGYNGHTKARIHRAPKTGRDLAADDAILVDGENEGVIALALDGDHVYWVAPESSGSTTLKIRRVARECPPPCTPESVGEITSSQPIVRMQRGQSGLLFALGGDGKVYAIEPAIQSARKISDGAGGLPSLAVAEDHAFVAGLLQTKVHRVDKKADTEHLTFPDGGQESPGGGPIATDCTRVYAYRKFDTNLWFADATSASSFEPFAAIQQVGVYDVFADRDYVYLASLDGFGIRIVDIATRKEIRKYEGSYYRVWADDTGLYAGDHSHDAPGAIYFFGD